MFFRNYKLSRIDEATSNRRNRKFQHGRFCIESHQKLLEFCYAGRRIASIGILVKSRIRRVCKLNLLYSLIILFSRVWRRLLKSICAFKQRLHRLNVDSHMLNWRRLDERIELHQRFSMLDSLFISTKLYFKINVCIISIFPQ